MYALPSCVGPAQLRCATPIPAQAAAAPAQASPNTNLSFPRVDFWLYCFRNMSDEDLKTIFAYLKTLTPVKHRVDNTETPTAKQDPSLEYRNRMRPAWRAWRRRPVVPARQTAVCRTPGSSALVRLRMSLPRRPKPQPLLLRVTSPGPPLTNRERDLESNRSGNLRSFAV